MIEAAELYRSAFHLGLTPDPDRTVSEWSDEFRMLSQKASAEPGRWRTDRTPYLGEIMDELSPSSPTQEVIFMAGAQIGKTETGNNWLGFVIHYAPGPMLLVQPTVDMAKRLSKQRLAPMIEETPVLRERIAETRSRDSGNTQLVKEFQGGVMVITGANSAVGLRSMPVRYAFLDEIDGWPVDVDGEGDPVRLAVRRTTTFARRKIYMCSTPTIKEVSRIEREYLSSDQRKFFVPCPHCDHKQVLLFKNLKWENDDPKTAMYACEECGCLIEERYKTQMLQRGEWRATAASDGKRAGFHLSSLYSPLGWKSWAEIVEEFIAAKGDAPLLKQFVNTILAETWEDEIASKVGADGLRARVEFYENGVAPSRVLAVTAGVDVQDNRLAVSLYGWGRDEESWIISHQEIFGDPSKPEVWRQLDEVLLNPVKHEIADPLPIAAACVDSGGHFTHEVYQYCRERRGRHIMAIKGQSQRGKPAISKPTKVDINWRGKLMKSSAEVWPVGSDTIKSVLYARMKHNEPGAGYMHFHGDLPDGFFEQLTAEKQVTRYVKGFPVREWTKKAGARNEALDTAVYAYAAMQSLYMRFARKTIWDQFERVLEIKGEKKPEIKQELPKNSQNVNLRKRSNFVTRF